jgi:hypothetical protein
MFQAKKKGKPWYKNFALKVLIFDLCTVAPFAMICASLKLANNVLGTDVAVTLFFTAVVVSFQYGNTMVR